MNMPVRAVLGGQFLKHTLAGYLAPCPRFAGRCSPPGNAAVCTFAYVARARMARTGYRWISC
jgi:hypothetical protein